MYEFLSTTKGLAQYIMSRLVRQFFWHAVILLSFVTVTGNLSAQQQKVEGFGKGGVEIDYPFNGVPLLQDFYFRFTSSDHHIQNIFVDPFLISNKIFLAYADNNNDDEFFYKAAHQIIPGTGVQINEVVFFPRGKEKTSHCKTWA